MAMTPLADRARLSLALLVPSFGGLAYLHLFGAPARLIAVNAAALLTGLVCTMALRWPERSSNRLGLALAAAFSLFLPLLVGPEVGGVTRWLAAGPVSLNTGALLLPLVTVLVAQDVRLGPVVLAIAGAGLAVQPDPAGLLALAAAAAALALHHRSALPTMIAAASLALVLLTLGAGTLEPQRYTEEVLPHVAAQSPLFAAVLAILLFAAPVWLLAMAAPERRAEHRALAAAMLGIAAIAILAPFPYPLIGYGASPILGLGLALSAVPMKAASDPRQP